MRSIIRAHFPSFLYLGSIEAALRRRGAQSAADDDRPPRERREDAFEMVKW